MSDTSQSSNPIPHTTKISNEVSHIKEVKLLQFAGLIVRHPFVMMAVCMLLVLIMTGLGMQEFAIVTAPPKGRSAYSIASDKWTISLDALIFAQRTMTKGDLPVAQQTLRAPFTTTVVMYEAAGDNIFTLENIEIMKQIEDDLKIDGYKDYCWLCNPNPTFNNPNPPGCSGVTEETPVCRPPLSPINVLYPRVVGEIRINNETLTLQEALTRAANMDEDLNLFTLVNPVLDNHISLDGKGNEALTQEFIDVVLGLLSQDRYLNPEPPLPDLGISFYFDKDFSHDNQVSKRTRSSFLFGLPLDGYVNDDDRVTEQYAEADAYTVRQKKEVLDQIRGTMDDKIDISYTGGDGFFEEIVNEILMSDALFAIGAMVFVFAYIRYHTGSWFIASLGMLHIVLSFPTAFFWSRIVFQIKYFDTLNVFLIFVILGIGADDIFVFVDAWKQSEFEGPVVNQSLEHRMSRVYRRASKAMFVTSFTTAIAFLANALSAIVPNATFGIFASLMIMMNYVLVITWFPAVVVVWHLYFRNKFSCCPPRCKATPRATPRGDKASTSVPVVVELEEPSDTDTTTRDKETMQEIELSDLRDQRVTKKDQRPSFVVHNVYEYNSVERFLYSNYGPWLIKWKKYIVLCFAVFVTVFAVFAARLEAADDPDIPVKDTHYLSKIAYSFEHDFPASIVDGNAEFVLIYGIKNQVKRKGYSMFDFGSEECEGGPCGKGVEDKEFEARSVRAQIELNEVCELQCETCADKSQYNVVGTSSCFMGTFKSWLEDNNRTFPIQDENEFDDSVTEFFSEDLYRSQFISGKLIKIEESGHISFLASTFKVDYFTGKFYTKSQVEVAAGWFDDFVAYRNSNDKNTVFYSDHPNHGILVNGRTADEYTRTSIRGIGISLALAFVVLFVSTANLPLAFIATSCICGIVVCVLGFMVMLGWKLSALEAICATLVVGFSVDFIVHFANSYIESKNNSRESRVLHALFEMGVSVLAGGTTTLLASLFLFPTTLEFFSKFGIFICSTIILSLLFSFGLFMAVMAWIGPEGTFGDVTVMYKNFKKRFKNNKVAAKEKEGEPSHDESKHETLTEEEDIGKRYDV